MRHWCVQRVPERVRDQVRWSARRGLDTSPSSNAGRRRAGRYSSREATPDGGLRRSISSGRTAQAGELDVDLPFVGGPTAPVDDVAG